MGEIRALNEPVGVTERSGATEKGKCLKGPVSMAEWMGERANH
jgi:hypothetical protein